MGHKISETDQESMRQELGIEAGGKVAFQDFADLGEDSQNLTCFFFYRLTG